jgi:hypothetical protein
MNAASMIMGVLSGRRPAIIVDLPREAKRALGGKIPYSISMKDDAPIVFAGVVGRLEGFTPARSSLVNLSGEAGKEVLAPYPVDRMKAYAMPELAEMPAISSEIDSSPPAEAPMPTWLRGAEKSKMDSGVSYGIAGLHE